MCPNIPVVQEARGLGRRRLRDRVEGRPEGGGEQQVHAEFGAGRYVYQGLRGPRRGRHSTSVKEDWDELGLKAEDRAFITQIAKDMHPEYWWVETTEGREWTGDHMKEGELTFLEARHLRNIHDGMEERLGKRGL